MTLAIRLNGFDYSGFTGARVERNLETAASSFSFTTTSTNLDFIPIREGDLVEIIVDEKFKIITGFIDEYLVEYDKSSHTINVKGRSITQDLIDCTVGTIKEFKKINLVKLCEIVASDFNINVINNVTEIKTFTDISSAEIGQTAFEFLESFARKRQVLLTDDGDGNLVLTRSGIFESQNNLKNLIGAIDNNIKKASRKINIANLYGEYIANGQQNPIDVSELVNAQELSGQIGFATDSEIRSTRRYEFYTEETTESFTLQDRAKWELALRRARSFSYNCTVRGHSVNDEVWGINNIYRIDDDLANLGGQFLCNKISYIYNISEGSITELGFTNKNSYTLQADIDKIILDSEST